MDVRSKESNWIQTIEPDSDNQVHYRYIVGCAKCPDEAATGDWPERAESHSRSDRLFFRRTRTHTPKTTGSINNAFNTVINDTYDMVCTLHTIRLRLAVMH